MNRMNYAFRLAGEIFQFARERKIYWLVPLMILLMPVAFLIATSEIAAPLIYTLF